MGNNPTTSDDSSLATGYDANSWKTMIPATCQSFHDGCNECARVGSGEDAACTKMACETYTAPYCKDELPSTPSTSGETEVAEQYLGFSVEDAMVTASKNNTPFRVVELDGEPQAATMDYRPGRINATVNSGKVTAITIE